VLELLSVKNAGQVQQRETVRVALPARTVLLELTHLLREQYFVWSVKLAHSQRQMDCPNAQYVKLDRYRVELVKLHVILVQQGPMLIRKANLIAFSVLTGITLRLKVPRYVANAALVPTVAKMNSVMERTAALIVSRVNMAIP